MNNLIATKICSSSFHWSLGLGVAEASDLGRIQFLGRVWNDACDQGFVVVSVRTGVQIIFVLDYIDWGIPDATPEQQDEIAGWYFRSIDGKHRILIIND